MCFTMGMSAFFGTLSFASSLYEYKCFKSVLYSVGLAYWGVMEWLQAIQHLYVARPEDDYAMCKDPTNMFLTDLGGFHIIFQPFFLSILIMSMYRRHDITARIEADLISKLCLAMVFWYLCDPWFSAFMGGPRDAPSRGTKDCPNYMWLKEGYDAFLGKETPNLPGRPCTYYAPTRTGHLAWAAPVPLEMYFSPGNSVHFFVFFAPYFVMFKRPLVQIAALLLCITGPIMAQKVTPSVNEQPAIWCFFSVTQQILFTVTVRWKKLYKQPILEKIHHEGIFDEQPLTYYRSAQAIKDEACVEVEAPLPCKFTKHV